MKFTDQIKLYGGGLGALTLVAILASIHEQLITVGPWVLDSILAALGSLMVYGGFRVFVAGRKHWLSMRAQSLEVQAQEQQLEHNSQRQELELLDRRAEIHLKLSRLYADPNGNYPVLIPGRFDLTPQEIAGNLLMLPPGQAPRVRVQEDKGQQPQLAGPQLPGPCLLSQALTQFTPSLDRILLGFLPGGDPVISTADGLCHVALAGSTGGGKSVLIRMLMAQLCYAGARMLLLNPHYTRYDVEHQEDWTPYTPYLMYDPMECRRYDVIAHYLEEIAVRQLEKRLDRYANSQPVGKPLFLIVDEIPAIVKHVPEAPDHLAAILREGRKVGLFLISASQDFLVKTIAPGGGGAVRDCYRTAAYVGGDAQTARTLLDIKGSVNENGLGKGVVMLRGGQVKQASLARIPYVDNQALYQLLGPSTYEGNTVIQADDETIEALQPRNTTGAPGAPLARQTGSVFSQWPDSVSSTNLSEEMGTETEWPANVRPFTKNTASELEERPDTASSERPKEYRLNEQEIHAFIAAFKASGNREKALAAISRGSRYRQHAEEIIQAYGLRREA